MAKPIKKQLWSNIDVFGLLNGIAIWDEQYQNLQYVRSPIEGPLDIRDKIKRHHDNPPNLTKQGLINGLSNDLGLTPYNTLGSTIFELTVPPVPSGEAGVQDVFLSYQDSNGSWISVTPQVWNQGYQDAKANDYGFIVWQVDRYNNLDTVKNFRYSNIIEIFGDFDDETKFKVVYPIYQIDEDNNRELVLFTDMDNPNNPEDTRFTYRKPYDPVLGQDIVAYTLNDIPSGLVWNRYYDQGTGIAKDFLYVIKNHIDGKFKHRWNEISNNTAIWDIHKIYGSGHIPHFYDATIPVDTVPVIGDIPTGYFTGGVESFSESLYFKEIEEVRTGGVDHWYPVVFPGKFYLDGTPYYLFENMQYSNLEFTGNTASLPAGIERYHHTILVQSGFYANSYNDPDILTSGKIYEDYNYMTGDDGAGYWYDIYRRRPYLTASMGHEIVLDKGQYAIDFDNNQIHCSGLTKGTILWDNVTNPSGVRIEYDINPLNDKNITLEKYFVFLSHNSVTSKPEFTGS